MKSFSHDRTLKTAKIARLGVKATSLIQRKASDVLGVDAMSERKVILGRR
jgi:hypothetical protein